MSFEYIVEPEQKNRRLNDGDADALASKIASEFIRYNDARQTNLEKADRLIDEIFFRYKETEGVTKEEKWKTKVKMCKAYMFYQTLKAFIWKNIYANVNSMFDVSGENQETDNNSNKQKSNLVYVLDKMGIQKTLDKIIDNSMFYGELISFTAWKKKYQQYRRPIDYFTDLYAQDPVKMPLILEAVAAGKNYYTDEEKIYDDPYVYDVNPANLVFDVSQRNNWDSCPKIYKSYKTPDDILKNKLYKISPDAKEYIKNLPKDNSTDLNNQTDRHLKNETVNGGTVEVLEHWGDLKLLDGTVLKNWHAVVVARKFLVQFEKNERILNPFTYADYLTDPKTKRGISLIYAILDLAMMQEDFYNRTCNLQALTENPPIYAPEGFFDDDEVQLYPGKIVTYGDNLSPSNITPFQFNASVFNGDITYLSDMMAEISGIFPNMVGQEEAGSKTATEISTKAQGQVTRLAMIIDTINQGLIIPMVENVAKLLADFKFGVEEIYVDKDNNKETIQITDEIRQGKYKYTYSDRTLTADRIQKADMVVSSCERFAKFIPLNVQEIFTWYMEQKGVENPERFLQQGVQLPQEIQNYLAQTPEVQALLAGYQQKQQDMQNGKQQPVPQEPVPPEME